MCLAIVSCGDKENGKTDDGKTTPIKAETFDDIGSYKLVRGDTCSEDQKAAAVSLRKALGTVLDKMPALGTDYDGEKSKEILIGNTKREESVKALEGLHYDDYVIKQDGTKIVIAAGSDEALTNAVNFFIENFIDTESKTVKIPTGDGYTYSPEFTFDKLTVDGNDISTYKIYKENSLLTEDEVNNFAMTIRKSVIGMDIELAHETSEPGDGGHYIILDGTNLVPYEYSITVENGDIVIKGSCDTLPLAMAEFLGNYTKGIGAKEYNLTSADNKSYEAEKKTIPYTKDQLMKMLTTVYNSDEILFGDEVQGAQDPNTIHDTVEAFAAAAGGEYPSIIGIDLACYGIQLMDCGDEKWSSFICDIVDYCSEGGVITASSHFDNPGDPEKAVRGNILGLENTSDGTLEEYEAAFEELLTEGTDLNVFWKNELTEDARFLKALGDQGVTVLWRPLHESNGSWFWYCTTQGSNTLDPSYLQRMWIYIYDYYVNELGLTNLIWNYGPNTSSNVDDAKGTTMSPWYCYPGEEYVDMVGVDWYTSSGDEITDNDNYLTFIDTTRKIGAVTEFGPAGSLIAEEGTRPQEELFNCMDLYGIIFDLQREGYNFTYFLTWGGKWGLRAMGKGEEFMKSDIIVTRSELKTMFEAMK